jgi:uncharacterized membrane protein HdeD (DUF308 family)
LAGGDGEGEVAMLHEEAQAAEREVGARWWWFLLVGIAWFVIAVVVLRMNLTSVTTVGVLIGVLFLVAALGELLVAAVREHWRWAHVLLSAFFLAGAIWCFIRPYNAFWSLAAAFGFLLILLGALNIFQAIESQPVNNAWWLGLVAGILEIGLGFWASEQYVPARAALLLLFVGFYALFQGFAMIAVAFHVKSLGKGMEHRTA